MNATVLVVPPGVLMLMFLTPRVAPATLRVAVIVVEFTVTRLPGARVTPPVSPCSVIPVLVKLVPVKTT